MALYFILSSLVLAVSAGMTFSTKTVTHKQTLVCLFLFPIVYLGCGLPLADVTTQILAAAIVFVIGYVFHKSAKVGGGVVYAVTIAALWIPSLTLLFEYLCLAGIIGGAVTLVVMGMKSNSTERVEHYAAVVMAVCSGFFIFQYTEVPAKNIAPHEVHATAAPSSSAPDFSLRGLSDQR